MEFFRFVENGYSTFVDGAFENRSKRAKLDPTKNGSTATLPPSDDFPTNQVIDELEVGLLYKDRVLIPVRVVVASDQ